MRITSQPARIAPFTAVVFAAIGTARAFTVVIATAEKHGANRPGAAAVRHRPAPRALKTTQN